MTSKPFNNQVLEASEKMKPYAIKMTRNATDAEDLIQEAVCKALTSRDKFKEGTNLSAWLYTIMKNIFINQYRRRKNFQTIRDFTENDYLLENIETDFNRGEANMTIKELNYALNKLEEPYKKPLEMHHTGYKYKEIASEFGVPIGTIKSRIYAGRKKIKSYMNHGV